MAENTTPFEPIPEDIVFGVPVDPDSSVKTETPREGLAAYQTKSFQEAANAFNIPNPTAEDVDNHARKYGYSPESYREELGKYIEELEAGGDAVPDTTSVGRIAGRAVGDALSGIADFGEMIIGEEAAKNISKHFEELKGVVPDNIRRTAMEVFDPANPDHIGGDIENIGGIVGSYVIPATGFVKGVNLANKGIKTFTGAKKAKGAGLSDDVIDDVITVNSKGQALKPVNPNLLPVTADVAKSFRRSDAVKKTTKGAIKWGTGFAFGATVVEDPKENFVNILVEQFPETLDIIKPLAVNPEDEKAKQYLNAFLNNIGLEAIVGPIVAAPFVTRAYIKAGKPSVEQIATAANKMENSTLASTDTSLEELGNAALKDRPILKKIAGRLTSRMGTNDSMLASIIRMEQAGPAALTLAKASTRDLKKAAVKDVGKGTAKSDQFTATMNDALAGKEEALKEIESLPNVSRVIDEMRTSIDELSEAIGKNLGDSKLKFRIDENYNTYLNRTYRAFDDPTWRGLDDPFFKSGEGIQAIKNAEDALRSQHQFAEEDIPHVMKWIANGMKRESTPDVVSNAKKAKDFVETLTDYSMLRNSNPLARRKDLGEPFRVLMGEIKNPYQNYANTFEKLNVIRAEQDFLREVLRNVKVNEVAKRGLGKEGNIPPVEGYVPLKADVIQSRLNRLGGGYRTGTQVLEDGTTVVPKETSDAFISPLERIAQDEFGFPLEKLYVDPVYAQAIKNGTEILAPSGGLMRTWVASKALSQIMKTVASPATHARNVMGNNIIMLANGMLPLSVRGEFSAFAKRLADMETKEIAKLISEAQKVGVIDSGVKAGTVRGSLKDFAANPQGRIARIASKTALGRAGKKAANLTFRLYQDEDNLYKFMHYNKTKNYLQNAFPNRSADEIIEMAAERTRDLMPNYNLVSRQLKHMRRWPVGDFLSFPAEMIRVSKNLGKYTLKDLRSGNKTLMREAMKRLGGMTAAGLGVDVAQSYSRDAFGISAEQDEAINKVVPSYEKDVPRLYLSSIYKDKNNRNAVDYVNFGPIDPFDYLKYSARAVHTAILNNEDVDWGDWTFRVVNKQLSPFVGSSMVLDAGLKLYDQSKSFDSRREEDIKNLFLTALSPFEPGFMPAVRRSMQAERSLKDLNSFRQGRGAIGKYGQTLGEGDADLFANLAGVRVQTLDLNSQFGRLVNERLNSVKDARKTFTGSPAFKGDRTIVDPQQLYDAYVNSQEIKIDEMQKLKNIIEAFQYLTADGRKMTEEDIFNSLTKDKVYGLKDMEIFNNARRNIFIADAMTDPDFNFLIQSGKINLNSPEVEAIYNWINSVNGTKLED